MPAGSFLMGSPASEKARNADEGPQHRVTIARPFAIGKYLLTFDEWDECMAEGVCGRERAPNDGGWGRGKHPAIAVDWDDAPIYLAWLSKKAGQTYRLPTEAEWEYAARAGTTTPYYWGSAPSRDYANYGADKCCHGAAAGRDMWIASSPVGSFPPNAFGLYDMLGNVWEWVQDCYSDSYAGAPTDGTARIIENCGTHVRRGGSYFADPRYLRSAYRFRETGPKASRAGGLRVARGL